MPSTAELEERFQKATEKLGEDLVPVQRQIAQNNVAAALRRLEDGRYRDQLKAERPEGCWCLGTGGRDGYYYTADGTRLEMFCTCPDGKDYETRWRAKRQKEMDEKNEDRLYNSLIPLRFRWMDFAGYPATKTTAPIVTRVREWAEGIVPDQKRSLFLYGPYGSGKTGLAVAALKTLMHQTFDRVGWPGLFTTVPNLLDAIRRGYDRDAEDEDRQLLGKARDISVLLLDDIGVERVTDWAAEKLFNLINHRHDEDSITIFTSNLDLQALSSHIGERTVWRIVEMAEVIKVDGPNLRDVKP